MHFRSKKSECLQGHDVLFSNETDQQCDLKRSIFVKGTHFSLNVENKSDCLAADKVI